MRAVWPGMMVEAGCNLSLSTIARSETLYPKIGRGFFRSGRKSFTLISLIDKLSQVVATEKFRHLIYDYPQRSGFVAEYNSCNRFWNLPCKLQVGSVLGHCGRIYVGGFVKYQVGTEIFSCEVQIIFMENNKIFPEVLKILKFTHISTYLHGSSEETFGVGIPDDRYFMPFTSLSDPDCVVVMANDILESGSCRYIQLIGFLEKSEIEIKLCQAPSENISSFYFKHPAKEYARQDGLSVLLVLLNFFSDETCVSISKAPIIFENLSFSLANLPFKSRCDTVNSYVLSSAKGV
jgi:hypothetical protein